MPKPPSPADQPRIGYVLVERVDVRENALEEVRIRTEGLA